MEHLLNESRVLCRARDRLASTICHTAQVLSSCGKLDDRRVCAKRTGLWLLARSFAALRMTAKTPSLLAVQLPGIIDVFNLIAAVILAGVLSYTGGDGAFAAEIVGVPVENVREFER